MPLTPFELEALKLSLTVALWSVAICLPLGLAAAVVIVRCEFPGKVLFDGLVHLPLILPPVVVGYVLLVVLGRHGVVGGWLHDVFGLSFAFTWKGAAIAAAVMAFPLMVRSIRQALEGVDPKLEQAARTMGAGRLPVFRTVTLPLIMPGVLSGVILAFARSLGEFGATITFVSNIPGETRTLPLALYTAVQSPGGEDAAVNLMVLSVTLALVALIASEMVTRRLRKKQAG